MRKRAQHLQFKNKQNDYAQRIYTTWNELNKFIAQSENTRSYNEMASATSIAFDSPGSGISVETHKHDIFILERYNLGGVKKFDAADLPKEL